MREAGALRGLLLFIFFNFLVELVDFLPHFVAVFGVGK
jgi:hypothetical protein